MLAGLGHVSEASKLLESSHAILAAEFGTSYEAVGEAKYYITLIELRTVAAQNVGHSTSALKQACTRAKAAMRPVPVDCPAVYVLLQGC